jgi:hypothetical protein
VSKDLPLWENDESDVKLEYRLQFGHALVSTSDIQQVLKITRSVFKLSKPITVSNKVELKRLPQEQKRGVFATLLNDDHHWHFILAQFDLKIAIFAPHFLFFNSTSWNRLGKKLKVQLAYIHQLDVDSFGYTVFAKGKRMCNAHRDQSGIHHSKMTPIEFYLDGKLIHRADDEKDQFTEDTLRFISEDMIICVNKEREIRFMIPLSKNEFREPSSILHAVFACKQLQSWKT